MTGYLTDSMQGTNHNLIIPIKTEWRMRLRGQNTTFIEDGRMFATLQPMRQPISQPTKRRSICINAFMF